jgi:uncharacterized membrane protein
MVVVVFDNQSKAYEGKEALTHLDAEGSVVLYGYAVVAKDSAGRVTVKQSEDLGPVGTLVGSSLGALLGAIGGPVGLAIGATLGLAAGSGTDLHYLSLGDDFIDDVSKELLPNRYAVIGAVDEEWTTPLDERMEAIGGIVFRRALADVKSAIHDEHTAAMKADIAQMKAEHAKARAGRKAKLQEKINQLEVKLQAHMEKGKEKRDAAERQAKAKVGVLEAKASKLKSVAAETRI